MKVMPLNFHNVQSLHCEFHQGYYHDELIPTFHNLTQLKLLCYDYSMEFLIDVFSHCPKLQRFDLDEIDVDDEEFLVDVLSHCPKLQRFDLDEIDVDEELIMFHRKWR
ncbi:hypothetical protein P8452_64279 [Trifolium repens]|nr:hypothetical protein P8452_64279 [Trifolium repens]